MVPTVLTEAPTDTVLEMSGISKSYGAVQALSDVHLALGQSEVLAVVGDNGAGKSTLMRILAGALEPDDGRIAVRGRRVKIEQPDDARALGIEMVYQDLALFPDASIAWNIYAGRELTRNLVPFMNERAMREQARAVLERLGIGLDPTRPVSGLSGGQRQMVAIARALAFQVDDRILILDEPTAALGQRETAAVHELIRSLREGGHASIVLISHHIPSVLELANKILVLRQGRLVAARETEGMSVRDVVDLIVGGEPIEGCSRDTV